MGKRVTIYTIANQLGISATTVYRALNDKPKVSEKTKTAVQKVAKDLGFKANTLAQSLARKPVRLAVLIYTGFPEFHRYIILGAKQTAEELRDYNVHVDYFSFDEGNNKTPKGIRFYKDALRHTADSGYDGLLVVGEAAEEFRLLEEKNIPVATAGTDIKNAKRRFCVQYDGFTAGHIAAELLYWRLGKNGKVALATGHPETTIHQLTGNGFLEQAKISNLKVLGVNYNYDNEETAYKNTTALLSKHPDVQGIYINSSNTNGVIQSVMDRGMAGKISLITTDINDKIRKSLNKGIVSATIFQNQFRQGRVGLRLLYQYIAENLKVDDLISVNPEVIFRCNMALYT